MKNEKPNFDNMKDEEFYKEFEASFSTLIDKIKEKKNFEQSPQNED